ncbi:MAG: ABC transporter ATP-binding protein [Pseudolabrys sp.]|nr:ABC transporter ATP-binding protein [Pseudolabrys sp.]MBV9956172.1 ABC transporter ATP-binding protein [Pseudolabrys sp.]
MNASSTSAGAGVSAVSVQHVTKRFNETTALDGVSLEIRRGEFFSLLGPSGCGKTTLLRIIGGFEEADSGEVLIAGRNVGADPPYRRRTNMIFQHLALFPHLTVSENIAFGLEMKKVSRTEIDRKVGDILKLVRLEDYGKRKIDELSGGQKQRVAIARALVNEPEVLLLDEPLGALDLQLRLQMHDELKRIHRAIGSTFILVTHDQTEAITLSDRIAVMNAGQIVQLGTPADIYSRPINRFVANFIGHANFIDGEVAAASENKGELRAGGVIFAGRTAGALRSGQPATAVLRYEHLRILPASSSAGLSAVVEDVAFHGSSFRVTVRAEGGIRLVSEIAGSEDGVQVKLGDAVRVDWRPESLTILDQ